MPEITVELLLFLALAGVSALTAIGVVAAKSPVRSALSLIANFFSLAMLYFLLQAEMLGIIQVVVYTGAIMVLFLFVIMLLNLGAPNMWKEQPGPIKLALGGAFGLALFGLIGAQVIKPLLDFQGREPIPGYGGPQALGRALFTTYVWPFEVASILLLIGIVGSILLAKRRIS